MEDLIASLYARDRNDNEAESALELPENKPRFVPATPQVTDPIGRHSRESTASLDGGDGEKDPNVKRSTASRLQLTFALGPKTGPGFLFGTDPKVCDVVLPKLPNISRRHCYVTFDAARRLILRDCSKHGTVVRYGKTEGEQKKRRHFTWILGGPDLPSEISSVVIELDEQMVFQVVVAEPSFPRVFANNVDRFMQSMNTALTLDGLGIQSAASTAAASGVHTPSEDSILFVRRELGAGGFATVDLVWDVSTGIQYASKTIRDPRVCDWEREVRLMKKIRHAHVVQLHSVIEAPKPQLILEYLPLGSLYNQHRLKSITDDEVITVLCQGLEALTYLHEQVPPISHRDIKPDNILVQSRDPFQIKLADFGLSEASYELETWGGTNRYMAPELAMYSESRSCPGRYTHAVDIWSFGTVIYEYAYGLPFPSSRGLAWCQKLVDALQDWDSDPLIDLLLNMIVMVPEHRMSARRCLEIAQELNHVRCSTPKPKPEHSQLIRSNSYEEDGPEASRTTERAVCSPPGRGSSKRERSSDGVADLHRSCSVTEMVDLLRMIKSNSGDDSGVDALSPAVTASLNNHLRRLRLAQFSSYKDPTTGCVVVTGLAWSSQVVVARFTSSELAQSSIASLAEQVDRLLALREPEPTTVVTRTSIRPVEFSPEPIGHRARKASRSTTSIDCRSGGLQTASGEVPPASAPNEQGPGRADTSIAMSVLTEKHKSETELGWTTSDDDGLPLTFPSECKDDYSYSI